MRKMKIDMWQEVDQIVKFGDEDYQRKMEFAKNFLNGCGVSGSDDMEIQFDSISKKTLIYSIYSIITEFEAQRKQLETSEDNPTG